MKFLVNESDQKLFSLACRESLALHLENEQHKKFVLQEASDYDIIHFIFEGEWSENNYLNEASVLGIVQKAAEVTSKIYDGIVKSASTSIEKIKEAIDDRKRLGKQVEDLQQKLAQKEKELTQAKSLKGSAVNFFNALKTTVEKGAAAVASQATKSYEIAKNFVQANPQKSKVLLGPALLSALLLFAAYKTYQRFFSRAAKACKGKSGADKTNCMLQFKIKALEAQVADLNAAKRGCNVSRRPVKCNVVLEKKIQKIKQKIKKLESKKA